MSTISDFFLGRTHELSKWDTVKRYQEAGAKAITGACVLKCAIDCLKYTAVGNPYSVVLAGSIVFDVLFITSVFMMLDFARAIIERLGQFISP